MKLNPLNLLVLCFALSCNHHTTNPQPTSTKPNIIYILADDLGYGELGAYGQTKIETPNIDGLAKAGMLFTQHYSGAPVCAPARAVLLTGQHLGHSYVRGNDEWNERGNVWSYKAMLQDSTLEGQRPLKAGTVLLPKILKEAGYSTGMIGKWGLGAPHTESIPTKMGFDYFFGYNCQRQAHTYNPVHLYENEHRYYLKNDTIPPRMGLQKGEDPYLSDSYDRYNQPEYSSTISFEKLMGFVKNHKEDPFFLYWATPIPHLPLQAPQNWVDFYIQKFGPEEPYFFMEGEKGGSYFPTRYPHVTYAAMVSYLDENVGKLVTYLKKEGLYDNTLIIFTSDNGPSYTGGTDSPWFNSGGPFNSEYGRGKGFLYEGGIRVPMIASWPKKIKPNTTTDHISAFWDILPTFCEITQAPLPKDQDGISLLNTLIAEDQQQHDYLYWEFPEYNGQIAVRMGEWKILWKDIKKGNKEIELYNLEEDLKETNNLSAAFPELITQFFEIIKKEHTTPEVELFKIEELEALLKTI